MVCSHSKSEIEKKGLKVLLLNVKSPGQNIVYRMITFIAKNYILYNYKLYTYIYILHTYWC